VKGRVEHEREREAVAVGDAQFERRSLRRDAVDLAGFAATPDASVRMDGHSLGMVEANRPTRAVGEDTRGGEIEDRLLVHGCLRTGRPSIVRMRFSD
jgi:hypothetical protein